MLGQRRQETEVFCVLRLVLDRKNNAQGICVQEIVSRNFYKFRFWMFIGGLLINTCFSA
jgi:hypothetical protein